MSTQEQQKRLPPPVATEWRLKDLTWPDPRVGGSRRTVKIICQEANGPCSLISLVNVLTLRGSIHIDPSRSKVDYDYLSSLIAEFLLDRQSSQSPTSPSLSLSSALSILPSTIRGLDLNPSFSSAGAFKEGDRDGGELALFELCGVRLTHGWVVDAGEGKESEVMGRVGSYDAAQSLLVAADVGGKGFAEDAAIVRHFLDSTQTQLTMSGLFAISDSLEAGEAVALFRNSHLSVLYKRPADASSHEPLLFCLVTDEAFRKEPEIMWESLADVSGSTTSYFTSDFTPSSSAGGDEPGLSAEEVVRRDEFASGGGVGGDDDYNMQLARQLQEEEDALAAQTLAFSSSRQPDLATRATSSPRTRKQFLGTAAPLSPRLGATTSRQSPEIGSGSFVVVPEGVQEEGQGGKERLEASRQRLEGQIGEGSGGAGAGGSGEVKGKGKEKKEKEKKKGKGCVVM